MSEITISTGHPDAGRIYAEALDRVTAERDALQALLTAADERADDLSSAATKALDVLRARLKVSACGVHYASAQMACHQLSAALKPAEGRGDSESIGGRCWSCKEPVTLIEWVEADGNCPHCNVEIDEAEGIKP